MDHGKSEWTESIHDQVIRLNTMTKQLVTLSRLDEGNTSNYPFAEFSLSKLASESVDSFAPTFKSKQLSFNSDIPSDINMKGNMYLINELFYIFFDNALKYTKSNGEASLTIKKNQNKKIEITFSNDIEDNEMDTEQLFERFYRSPNSVSKEGSGIGLSIAKEIIELHKGKVNVSVKEGKIYFNITL
jgi:signal transduction histidine kinase